MRSRSPTLPVSIPTAACVAHRDAHQLRRRVSVSGGVPAAVDAQPRRRIIADAGLTQLGTARTEKYPHVTFFFNGGRDEPFAGEDRQLVPSPKVATYDLQPEMSAPGVCDILCAALANHTYDFMLCNFANTDMVGHTGSLPAAIKAVETVDACPGVFSRRPAWVGRVHHHGRPWQRGCHGRPDHGTTAHGAHHQSGALVVLDPDEIAPP